MRPMEDHTSPTLVCARSEFLKMLITRLYERCPTTLPDEMPSRLLTRPSHRPRRPVRLSILA